MITSKQKIEQAKARRNEYQTMRTQLFQIKDNEDSTTAEKLKAMELIIKIDEGESCND